MTFRDLISEATPLFLDHGFTIVENSQNFIKYNSDTTSFTIAYDPRERSFYIHTGYKYKSLNELNNLSVKEIFGEDYGLNKYQSIEENLIPFLQGKGKGLLTSDSMIMDKLDTYTHQKAKEFTNQIIRQQQIRGADIAWSNKDYKLFLQQMDLIGKESLPESYTKKYKIALSKLNR